MNHQCDKTEIIHYIKESVDKIDNKMDNFNTKLDTVIAFKNKAIGVIIAFTTITTMTFNLIIFIFKK